MTLRELAIKYGNLWIYCRDDSLQMSFLSMAEEEGFLALNGQKPTELFHHTLYGLSDEMTMGYLSGMVWCYSARNPQDSHIRIDYEKYLADETDIFYHVTESDKEYDLVEIKDPDSEGISDYLLKKNETQGEEKIIKAGSKVRYLAESNWAYEKGKIYEVCGYDEELEAWAVMSEMGWAYYVTEMDLEVIRP